MPESDDKEVEAACRWITGYDEGISLFLACLILNLRQRDWPEMRRHCWQPLLGPSHFRPAFIFAYAF